MGLKKRMYLILFASLMILLIPPIKPFSAEDTWREVTQNPVFSIQGQGQDLYYQLGPNASDASPLSSETLTGIPDVYLKVYDENGGTKYIYHQFINPNLTIKRRLTTSTFLLGMNNGSGSYFVYSDVYKGSKIFINDKKEIKSEVIREFTSDGKNYKMQFNVYLIPDVKGFVKHKYVVTNLGQTTMQFIGMKNVDTRLNGNDNVPVRMLGHNEGVFIEDENYRLDYYMNLPNGPANFLNNYEAGWRQSIETNTNLEMNYYYSGASILGSGAEADNLQPNDIIRSKRPAGEDTGIMMKWDEVTVAPGESKAFEYDVGIIQFYKTSETYKNLSRESEKNFTGDTIELERRVIFDKGNGEVNNGVIKETIDERLSVVSEVIDFVDEESNVLRQVKTSDCIRNNVLTLPVNKSDIINGETRIRYDVVGASSLDGTEAENSINYSFNSSLGSNEANKVVRIPFATRDSKVTVKYVDQAGAPLQAVPNKILNVRVDDTYDVSTAQYKPNVPGYRLVTESLPSNAVGIVGDVPIEVVYTYIKQWNITFQTNGGSAIDNKIVDINKPVEKPADPVKPNNKFLGWYSDVALTTPWDFTTPITQNMTLYAKWLQESKLTVKYVDQDGNKIPGVDDKNLKGFLDDDYDVSTDEYKPEIDGYRLDTEKLPNNSVGKYTTAPIVVTYTYIKQWVVSFDTNGGNEIAHVIVDTNKPVAEPTPPVFDGTEFSGWYTTKTFNKKWVFTTPVTSDMTLYAKWRSDIVDPDDGITPVTPIDKTTGDEKTQNGTKDDLRIQYVSDFDFGIEKNSVQNMVLNSKGDYVKNNSGSNKSVVPFISIINDTTVGNTNPEWSLTATRTNFSDENNHKLKGERLLLSGLNYNNSNGKTTPSVTQGKFEIPVTGEAVVSKSKNNLGAGSWSMSLGELNSQEKSSGVELSIPKGTAKNNSKYTTVIDWTLVLGDL